ncbi:MAG: hypothetical protein WDO73_19245 [Ignavibacteriota bacterium]
MADRTIMAAASQIAASAVTRHFNSDALGFNPFGAPRLDEQYPLELDRQEELARYATAEKEARASQTLPAAILDCEGYGFTVQQFQLHATMPWYGLWAVSNEWKDVSDLASIKEQRSYALLDRPYKFLQTTDRASVDKETLGVTAAVRKQVPVLLDFNEGRVYIESNNKKLIYTITTHLNELGVQTIPVAWTYSLPNWTCEVLSRLYAATQYQADFQKRADEATRFTAKEIEKLEDRELESIVANYFSMTELPGELWAGISGPAQVRLHDASPSIGVKAPTTATTLLQMTDDATVISGAITFQERVTTTSKSRGEFTFRRDLLCVDVNDKINLTDVGAAMLRGFDIPALRKDIQREIRKTKQVPSIEEFWGNWLHELSNGVRTMESAFREILNLDGKEEAGILPMRVPEKEELLETVNS